MLIRKFTLPDIQCSAHDLEGATDLVKETLHRARTGPVIDALDYGTKALGFDSYAFGMVPNDRRPDADSRPYILTNQVDEWFRIYDERAYMELDPRVEMSAEPGYTYWHAAQFANNHRHKMFLRHAANYGICSGLVLGLCTRDPPSYAMMVFNWSAPTLDHWSPQDRLLIAAQASIIGKLLSRSMREFLNEQDLLFPAPLMSLTPRDLELLTLVASGFTSKEIGEMLGRARITVDTHMRTIVSKMGALNRNQAIAKAIAHKLIRVLDGGAAEYKSAKLRVVRGRPRLKSVK